LTAAILGAWNAGNKKALNVFWIPIELEIGDDAAQNGDRLG